jgi:hypothetical protein
VKMTPYSRYLRRMDSSSTIIRSDSSHNDANVLGASLRDQLHFLEHRYGYQCAVRALPINGPGRAEGECLRGSMALDVIAPDRRLG